LPEINFFEQGMMPKPSLPAGRKFGMTLRASFSQLGRVTLNVRLSSRRRPVSEYVIAI